MAPNYRKAPQGNLLSPQGNLLSPHGNSLSPHGNSLSPHGNSLAPSGGSNLGLRYRKSFITCKFDEDSEQVLLSPTESEIIQSLKQDDSVKELPDFKKRKEWKKTKFPNLVESLALVKKWKTKSVASPTNLTLQVYKQDTLISKAKEKSFPGDSKRRLYSPDTLANLARSAIRGGILGPHFVGLTDANAGELVKWRNIFTERQSAGLSPPLDEMYNSVQSSLLSQQGKFPELKHQNEHKSHHERKVSGSETEERQGEQPHIHPGTRSGLSGDSHESDNENTESSYRHQLTMQKGKMFLDVFDSSGHRRSKRRGDRNTVSFSGWDFGTRLGIHSAGRLPELSERAPQLIRRKPPKIPIDKMMLPTGASCLTPEQYLSMFAIYELLEFLTYSVALEQPDRPIEHMIEMTRAIRRHSEIQHETEKRVSAAGDVKKKKERT